ncbi:MAG: hypothetical protein JF628_06700 [Sphingomonas sp.]|jgi:hypothetical protein|nr:hypothetical protein [Sphingomonas sp.]MBW8844146.1 hypothetical protein [Burkholderiales bacterium]
MSAALAYELHAAALELSPAERDDLVISYVQLAGGERIPLSRYGDPVWNYTPFFPGAARGKQDKEIVWAKTPDEWVPSMRSAAAALTYRKAPGGVRLDPSTIPKRHVILNAFAKWASSEGIRRFGDVRAADLTRYIQKLRDDGLYDRSLASHIAILRKVHELRGAMLDSLTDEAATALRFDQLGALWEPDAVNDRRTELIPLAEASALFVAAREHLTRAPTLLRLRDDLAEQWEAAKVTWDRRVWGDDVKKPAVRAAGFRDALEFESAVSDIRTAAYIVLGITTGCRVHELGEAEVGCVYPDTVDGETYWWLKAATRKIGDGPMRWLAPEVAKEASDALEWHSAPLRARIAAELPVMREQFTTATTEAERARLAAHILELERNADRLFLSESTRGVVSTDTKSHNKQLKAFAARKGIKLGVPLATHRFRRTYAVIVVHLNKGPRIDMVTLQRHFKHASVLMTEWYAELSETDRELYELIETETGFFDMALVDHWLDGSTPLAGGLGARIKAYAGKHHQPIFFKTRREFVDSIREGINIRSTGHSWCLAEAKDCGGQGLFDAPQCGSCGNGVIDDNFREVWQNLRQDHEDLSKLDDIGPGGRAKAAKGLAAAEAVLAQLEQPDDETADV